MLKIREAIKIYNSIYKPRMNEGILASLAFPELDISHAKSKVSRLIAGKCSIKYDDVVSISEVLKVDPNFLFGIKPKDINRFKLNKMIKDIRSLEKSPNQIIEQLRELK